jgi:ATP-binding cassette, subfamily B, bacterial
MRNPFPAELLWLYGRVRPFLVWHLASFFVLTLSSALALVNPLALMWVLDRAIPRRDPGFLMCCGAVIFLCTELRTVLATLGAYLTFRASQRAAVSMRMEVLEKLNSLSPEYHENTPAGARLYALREPIDEVAYFGSDLLPTILRTILVTGFTIVAMLALNPRLTVLVVPAIPAFLLVRRHFRNLLADRADKVQHARQTMSAFLEEHIASVQQIQLLQQEKRQQRRAMHFLSEVVRTQVKLAAAGVQFSVWTNLPIAAAAASIVGFGAWSVLRGVMTVGGLVAFYGYIFQLFDPLAALAETYARAQRTFSSIRHLQSILALQPTVTNCGCLREMPLLMACQIRLNGVSFGYERQKGFLIIPGLTIESGEHVAIVGENGSGKSTFAKLVARLYDPDSGSIVLAESEVRHIPLEQLRSLVSYVPSVPILFDETLGENLRLGDLRIDERQLEEIVDLVGLRPLVQGLPQGLSQPLGPSGNLVSGGQRQRLALARALLRKPRVLILDEATSGLEPESERSILDRIAEQLPGVSILFVSHRPENVARMDRVLVFRQGRIVEDRRVNGSKSRAVSVPSLRTNC